MGPTHGGGGRRRRSGGASRAEEAVRVVIVRGRNVGPMMRMKLRHVASENDLIGPIARLLRLKVGPNCSIGARPGRPSETNSTRTGPHNTHERLRHVAGENDPIGPIARLLLV